MGIPARTVFGASVTQPLLLAALLRAARLRAAAPLAVHRPNEGGSGLKRNMPRIDHQVVVVRVGPPLPGIELIVVAAVAVDALDFGLGLRFGKVILLDAAGHGIRPVAAAEDAEHPRRGAQHEVGAAADDDAGPLGGQLLHNLALGNEEHVVGREAASGPCARREDALEPEGGD